MRGLVWPEFPALSADMHAEVCVIGAGIAGITVAYELARQGRSVIVLDDGQVAGGETSRTTAHLSNALDDRYQRLERWHGAEGAILAAESHTQAISRIEQIIAAENIDCHFERLDGFLFSPHADDRDYLQKEMEAAHRAGLKGVVWAEVKNLGGKEIPNCLCFPQQGQFHPLKYLFGLVNAATRLGVKIFTSTHVDDIHPGKPCRIVTSTGNTVTAKDVVVATNTPINDRLRIHTKQAAYRSYVIGLRLPQGTIRKGLYWDIFDPYHYVRLTPDPESSGSEILLVGGGDHKTGQPGETAAPFMELEKWAQEYFGVTGAVVFKWSGQIMETIDCLAFIGKNPLNEHIFIVTGDSGHGMTHGTIAGMLISDLILGRPNPWEKLYDPSRKTLAAAGEFIRETVNMAGQYGDWLTAGEVPSIDEIPRGSGAIVRRGAVKVAVYRDEAGQLTECSAICPHLGGIVRWNDVEKTWDCPAHGSRFDTCGKVLNGPAPHDLKSKSEDLQPVVSGSNQP